MDDLLMRWTRLRFLPSRGSVLLLLVAVFGCASQPDTLVLLHILESSKLGYRLDEMETPGVALFMQLPGPFDGLTGFEQMLETARALARDLHAQVLDARRCELTRQTLEHIRDDLLEYRRLAHLAARRVR